MRRAIGACRTLGRRVTLGVLLTLCLGLAVSGVWAAMRTAWVIPASANVRKSPSTSGSVVAQVSRGDKFFVTKFNDGWAGGKTASGKWGWIREDLLQFSADKGRELAGSSSSGSSGGSHPTLWVTVSNANVRSGPGLGYSRYGTLDRGTKLYLLERQGGWLRCKTPGGSGWLSDTVVTSDASVGRRLSGDAPDPPKAFIDGEVVNLRKGPGVNYDLVARVLDGQTVWVLDRKPNWAKVKVNNGAVGWVARDYLKPPNNAASMPPAPADFPNAGKSRFSTLTAWIDEDSCNIREGPGQDQGVKFQLAKGTKVTVTGMDGQWCKIKADNGDTGWVAGWVIDFSPPGTEFTRTTPGGGEEEVKIGWVSRPSVNLRSGPGENYPRTGTLALSTQVLIVGLKGDWYKVAMDNREIGWVGSWLIDTRGERAARGSSDGGGTSSSASSLTAAPTGGGPGSGSQSGLDIVHTAMKYLGQSYVRGGENPGGFDCSGLVQYVLGRHGISAERTSPGQFRQGRPVSRDEIEPGDVVFFKNTYRSGISHVGIYIGEGRFIHAANPGSGVKITGLDESYYASRYVGARRMH